MNKHLGFLITYLITLDYYFFFYYSFMEIVIEVTYMTGFIFLCYSHWQLVSFPSQLSHQVIMYSSSSYILSFHFLVVFIVVSVPSCPDAKVFTQVPRKESTSSNFSWCFDLWTPNSGISDYERSFIFFFFLPSCFAWQLDFDKLCSYIPLKAYQWWQIYAYLRFQQHVTQL